MERAVLIFAEWMRWSARTQRSGPKMYQERFTLNPGRFFRAKRLLKHWNRLSKEVVDVQGLSVFKRYFENSLTTSWSGSWTR